MKKIMLSAVLSVSILTCGTAWASSVQLNGSDISYYSQIKRSSTVSIATHLEVSTGVNSLKLGRVRIISGYSGVYDASRIYLSVDLSSLDTSESITSASLNIYQLVAGSCGNIYLYDYLPEASSSWIGTGRIDLANDPENKSLITTFAPENNNQFSFDVTTAIQNDFESYINSGGSEWSGFIIQAEYENIGTGTSYASFDYINNPLSFDITLASASAIPEPTTMALLGFGIIGILARRKRSTIK